jgi:hypothetical protein
MEGQNNFGELDSPKLELLKSPYFIQDTDNYEVISLVIDIIQVGALTLPAKLLLALK